MGTWEKCGLQQVDSQFLSLDCIDLFSDLSPTQDWGSPRQDNVFCFVSFLIFVFLVNNYYAGPKWKEFPVIFVEQMIQDMSLKILLLKLLVKYICLHDFFFGGEWERSRVFWGKQDLTNLCSRPCSVPYQLWELGQIT